MADYKETCVEYLNVDKDAFFCSGETKWINKILKLKAAHPDKVQIEMMPEDNQGNILARFPKSWLKISPPRQVNYTDEQKAAMAERLVAAREKLNS